MSGNTKEIQLFEDNIDLVYWVFHKYYPNLLYDEDAVQIAKMGLWKACKIYDESKGVLFSTIAVKCIRNELNYQIFRPAKRRIDYYYIDDLVPVDDSGYRNYDIIPQFTDPVGDKTKLCDGLSLLTEKEEEMVDLALQGLDQSQIAKHFGVSRQYICKLFGVIKKKLRDD